MHSYDVGLFEEYLGAVDSIRRGLAGLERYNVAAAFDVAGGELDEGGEHLRAAVERWSEHYVVFVGWTDDCAFSLAIANDVVGSELDAREAEEAAALAEAVAAAEARS